MNLSVLNRVRAGQRGSKITGGGGGGGGGSSSSSVRCSDRVRACVSVNDMRNSLHTAALLKCVLIAMRVYIRIVDLLHLQIMSRIL